MTARRNPDSPNDQVDAERLASPEFSAFLGTLDSATTIIGATDQILRDADAGVTSREFDALVFITAFGPIRPSELLRKVVLTHSAQTLSSAIDRLEARGLAVRQRDPNDPRAVLLTATDSGTELIDRIFPHVYRRAIAPFTSRYSESELTTIAELFDRP